MTGEERKSRVRRRRGGGGDGRRHDRREGERALVLFIL